MSKHQDSRVVDYFRLPRPLWRKVKKCLPKTKEKTCGRPRVSDQAVVNGIWYVLWTGCQWKVVHRDWFGVSASVLHERFQTWQQQGVFEKVMRQLVTYYAKRRGVKWRWQAIDSKSCAAPLGGDSTGRNPTDRGKRGSKLHLLVDKRSAPLAVHITGANQHDKNAAFDVVVAVVVDQSDKEQHLCADKAYDSADLSEFLILKGYTPHIKQISRRAKQLEEPKQDLAEMNYPARRWVVERTLSWLAKRRSIRTRWSKKVANWLG